jgi:hypothetical protein
MSCRWLALVLLLLVPTPARSAERAVEVRDDASLRAALTSRLRINGSQPAWSASPWNFRSRIPDGVRGREEGDQDLG